MAVPMNRDAQIRRCRRQAACSNRQGSARRASGSAASRWLVRNGCGYCARAGKCCHDDRVNVFLDAAKDADGFIFGAPVHFASASASMIAFLDRSFYADHCAGLNRFAFKPGAAIVSARRAGTSAALDELNKYLLYAQMPIVSSRYWNMVHGHTPAQVCQDEEGMQIMRVLGRNMAWMLNSLKIAADAGLPLPEQEKRISTNYIR